jgi:glycogen debranching enzyme
MAEVFDALGRPDRGTELRAKAAALFERFNDAFWDEESGFYAYALDGEKKKVLTVASNPGHCLWSGIVPPERAKKVVERLMAPDMWSGRGIRTLSALHPSFNPYNYQTGSVWPHDNGIIAWGFKAYGFEVEAAQIAHDISEAGSYFYLNQLPELYSALSGDVAPLPVQYLGANVPQAWAAGSVFMLMQAMLGFFPDAPRNKLYLDPSLPAWLPDLTVRDLRIGKHLLEIRFTRNDDRTEFEVLKGDAEIVERCDLQQKIARLKIESDRI